MYQLVCNERDGAIRKNADLSLSLREARKAMSSMPAPPSPALPVTPTHASPTIPPPTSLFPSTMATKAMTPSFAIPGVTSGGTPKASSLAKSHGFTLPPPPCVGSVSINQTTNEEEEVEAAK